MKEMWDNRYSSEDYAYGIAPNVFLKTLLKNTITSRGRR
jgi:hypothetical protein